MRETLDPTVVSPNPEGRPTEADKKAATVANLNYAYKGKRIDWSVDNTPILTIITDDQKIKDDLESIIGGELKTATHPKDSSPRGFMVYGWKPLEILANAGVDFPAAEIFGTKGKKWTKSATAQALTPPASSRGSSSK